MPKLVWKNVKDNDFETKALRTAELTVQAPYEEFGKTQGALKLEIRIIFTIFDLGEGKKPQYALNISGLSYMDGNIYLYSVDSCKAAAQKIVNKLFGAS